MQSWLRKLRGIAGLAAIGGILAAVFGVLVAVLVSLLPQSVVPLAAALWWGVFSGSFGVFAGAGFGVLLTSLEGRRSLEQLSAWRSALWGAVVGGIFPFPFALIVSGTIESLFWLGLWPYLVVFGGLGAALSGGMVAAAKRAHRRELGQDESRRSLPGGE